MTATLYPKPPYPTKWWETPLYWPADVAGGLKRAFGGRLGTNRIFDVVEHACMDAIEVFDTGRQHGVLCPCVDMTLVCPLKPDSSCDVCWGAGFIYTDDEGNVIGNHDPEEG